jgi:hypothetical protein
LRLGFRSFRFEATDASDGQRSYLLRLQRLALSVLGWSFPPGNRDVFLFGNPNGDGTASLGWYAAYDQGAAQAGPTGQALSSPSERDGQTQGGVPVRLPAISQTATQRRRRSGRRGLPPTAGL